jgi:hypothetical protein
MVITVATSLEAQIIPLYSLPTEDFFIMSSARGVLVNIYLQWQRCFILALIIATERQPVRGDIIKWSLESLEFLGPRVIVVVIEELETLGAVLDPKHFYCLNDVESFLTDLFGKDETSWLIQKIEKVIAAQFFARQHQGFLIIMHYFRWLECGFTCVAKSSLLHH